jgi:hypothetical protein
MDDLANTWVEDDAFDDAVAAFRSIDEALWRCGAEAHATPTSSTCRKYRGGERRRTSGERTES